MMPWPGAGTQASSGSARRDPAAEAEPPQPAAASTARRTRRRPACAGACRRCRGSARNVAPGSTRRQLRDAADAARADRRRARRARRAPTRGRRPDDAAGSTSASRGSSRGSVAAMSRPVGQHRRHVLGAVHREVDVAVEQRVFDLLDEQPLAADLDERRVLQPIAGGLDDDDLDAARPRCFEQRRDGRAPARARARCRACRSEAAALTTRSLAGSAPLRTSALLLLGGRA